ncbi:MAG: ribosomal protein S18-alanine N-acetyltransferase [Desulfobacterales bacterium]|jgi:ribosomal-protein-alanine N-acetyltransferase|nr:ribosomal protein S18-alanine N-acetyltransferase [Desulfobacterales bacterium]
MTWRPEALRPADLEAVLEIERLSFACPWGRLSVEGELSGPGAQQLVIRPPGSGAVAAYIFFRRIADEVHIFRIAVAPAWRRRGMGAQLVDACLQAAGSGARAALLEMRPSNAEAMALYRSFGFQVVGSRPGYYPDRREDALILRKQLKEEEL